MRVGKVPKCSPQRLSCLDRLQGKKKKNLFLDDEQAVATVAHSMTAICVAKEKQHCAGAADPLQRLSAARCLSRKASLKDQRQVDCKREHLAHQTRALRTERGRCLKRPDVSSRGILRAQNKLA